MAQPGVTARRVDLLLEQTKLKLHTSYPNMLVLYLYRQVDANTNYKTSKSMTMFYNVRIER